MLQFWSNTSLPQKIGQLAKTIYHLHHYFLCMALLWIDLSLWQNQKVHFSVFSDVNPACNCEARGNFYTPNVADDCNSFFQRSNLSDTPTLFDCPAAGLKFDVTKCVCNYADQVSCPVQECAEDSQQSTGKLYAYHGTKPTNSSTLSWNIKNQQMQSKLLLTMIHNNFLLK